MHYNIIEYATITSNFSCHNTSGENNSVYLNSLKNNTKFDNNIKYMRCKTHPINNNEPTILFFEFKDEMIINKINIYFDNAYPLRICGGIVSSPPVFDENAARNIQLNEYNLRKKNFFSQDFEVIGKKIYISMYGHLPNYEDQSIWYIEIFGKIYNPISQKIYIIPTLQKNCDFSKEIIEKINNIEIETSVNDQTKKKLFDAIKTEKENIVDVNIGKFICFEEIYNIKDFDVMENINKNKFVELNIDRLYIRILNEGKNQTLKDHNKKEFCLQSLQYYKDIKGSEINTICKVYESSFAYYNFVEARIRNFGVDNKEFFSGFFCVLTLISYNNNNICNYDKFNDVFHKINDNNYYYNNYFSKKFDTVECQKMIKDVYLISYNSSLELDDIKELHFNKSYICKISINLKEKYYSNITKHLLYEIFDHINNNELGDVFDVKDINNVSYILKNKSPFIIISFLNHRILNNTITINFEMYYSHQNINDLQKENIYLKLKVENLEKTINKKLAKYIEVYGEIKE